MQQINLQQIQEKLSKGAMLIDIREPSETAKEYIEDAEMWPLSQMPNEKPAISRKKEIIFFCRSGARTQMNAKKLDGAFSNKSYIMQGGIMGWKRAQLPTIVDKNAAGGFNLNYVIIGFILLFASYYLLK